MSKYVPKEWKETAKLNTVRHTNRAKQQHNVVWGSWGKVDGTPTQAHSIEPINDIFVNNNNFHETFYASTKRIIDKWISVITFWMFLDIFLWDCCCGRLQKIRCLVNWPTNFSTYWRLIQTWRPVNNTCIVKSNLSRVMNSVLFLMCVLVMFKIV